MNKQASRAAVGILPQCKHSSESQTIILKEDLVRHMGAYKLSKHLNHTLVYCLWGKDIYDKSFSMVEQLSNFSVVINLPI